MGAFTAVPKDYSKVQISIWNHDHWFSRLTVSIKVLEGRYEKPGKADHSTTAPTIATDTRKEWSIIRGANLDWNESFTLINNDIRTSAVIRTFEDNIAWQHREFARESQSKDCGILARWLNRKLLSLAHFQIMPEDALLAAKRGGHRHTEEPVDRFLDLVLRGQGDVLTISALSKLNTKN